MKAWRDAACLIVATRRLGKDELCTLMLKRSQQSRFMPNAYVFPGGNLDAADFSNEWIDVFKRSHVDLISSGASLQLPVRAPILEEKRDSIVPSDIGFRICAIREAFEESGVLLACRGQPTNPKGLQSSQEKFLFVSSEECLRWRQRVSKNATEFLTLCRDFRVIPNIWGLWEWANWLTPVDVGKATGRRYDTIFYIACLDSTTGLAKEDNEETAEIEWCTPSSMLERFGRQELWVPPPQIYELNRLKDIASLSALVKEVHQMKGSGRWMPVRKKCADGVAFLLPGDSAYPPQPDWMGSGDMESINETLEEYRHRYPLVRRMEMRGPNEMQFWNTVRSSL